MVSSDSSIINAVFNQLIGIWGLERQIDDRSGHGVLSGQCIFTPIDENRLLCEERGELRYNGVEIEASRSYIYECRDDKIIILYNDLHRKGDVLHELDFSNEGDTQIARHCHLCVTDTYDLEFQLLGNGKIQMNYVVKGPHKDYTMNSILTRHVTL